MEEGSWTRRSGSWIFGVALGGGIIESFELPNNRRAILEFTSGAMRIWKPSDVEGLGFGYALDSSVGTVTTDWTTPGELVTIRVIQTDDIAYILGFGSQITLRCTNYVSVTQEVDPDWVVRKGLLLGWMDGPYIDPFPGLSQTNNSLGSINNNSTTPTFVISDASYSFVSSDVGRSIRLWSQPPVWSGGTTYALGDFVTYNGTFWRNLVSGASTVGVVPGAASQPATGTVAPSQVWGIVPTAGVWAWGNITSVTNTSTAVLVLQSPNTIPTTQNGLVIDTWQLGLYTATIQPQCGTFHEGRLWLGGAVPNRFDACVTNTTDRLIQTFPTPLFSPTDINGNVFDDSGISYTVNSIGSNQFLWMAPDHSGILAGTASGEWLIRASALNDPLTPTSIQAHRASAYKCADSEPVRMGIGLAFIQAFGRRLIEYVTDVFSQKFIGRHLNAYAKDLTSTGLIKITYQEELAPVIWGVTADNRLLGCTYRRVSNFGQEAPIFNGWHQHSIGPSGSLVLWSCMGSNGRGTEDTLILMVQGPTGEVTLQLARPLFDASDPLWSAWYLDSSTCGTDGWTAAVVGNNIVLTGLNARYNGQKVTVFIAGLECGPFLCTGGIVTVPLGSDPDGVLTQTYLLDYQTNQGNPTFDEQAIAISGAGTVPCVVGFPMISTMTTQRPQTVEQTRSQTGPGPGKLRRLHAVALHLVNTITGANISIDDSTPRTLDLYRADRETKIDHQTLFTGIYEQEVEGDYSYDGQVTISTSSAYPLTVASITSFLQTQDR
jgi:hypothetical protein